MDFGQALDVLRSGRSVTREGWNGKCQYLTLQPADSRTEMTMPYIFITTVQNHRVPWVASQTDLLADDWVTSDIVPTLSPEEVAQIRKRMGI
jgi:hypothetical protein